MTTITAPEQRTGEGCTVYFSYLTAPASAANGRAVHLVGSIRPDGSKRSLCGVALPKGPQRGQQKPPNCRRCFG